MRRLIVSEFVALDGVVQAPGGKNEDLDGGFEHGGWTAPYWHDDIGKRFTAILEGTDAFLLGRKTYVTHAQAFEPLPRGDAFGDLMNRPKKSMPQSPVRPLPQTPCHHGTGRSGTEPSLSYDCWKSPFNSSTRPPRVDSEQVFFGVSVLGSAASATVSSGFIHEDLLDEQETTLRIRDEQKR